jgi:hypothetical protein
MKAAGYVPVPVESARQIATEFHKSMVVILSYDPKFQVTHTTTYGVSPQEKEIAADFGERCAALVSDLPRKTSYEDFRFMDQAKRAQQVERLSVGAKAARSALLSLLAVRNGISDELLREVVEALNKGLYGMSMSIAEDDK